MRERGNVDVVFYETFAEEERELARRLPSMFQPQFFDKTIYFVDEVTDAAGDLILLAGDQVVRMLGLQLKKAVVQANRTEYVTVANTSPLNPQQ